MVMSRERPQGASRRALLAAVKEGLDSLTVTGPSPALEAVYREALEAVRRRPSREEREKAITLAWLASSSASSPVKAADELYRWVRLAISASRPQESE
jgi:hypothetical protein